MAVKTTTLTEIHDGFSMENLCSIYGVSWCSTEIPWNTWYTMEVTAVFHMNLPWSAVVAMVFHRNSMVTMVFPWNIISFTAFHGVVMHSITTAAYGVLPHPLQDATLNDLERRNGRYFALFHRIR